MQRSIKFIQIRASNKLEYFYTMYLGFIKFQITFYLLEVANLYMSPDINPCRNIMINIDLQQYPSNGCTRVGPNSVFSVKSNVGKMATYQGVLT